MHTFYAATLKPCHRFCPTYQKGCTGQRAIRFVGAGPNRDLPSVENLPGDQSKLKRRVVGTSTLAHRNAAAYFAQHTISPESKPARSETFGEE